MGTFRQRMVAIATVLAVFAAAPGVSRSVNISSTWLLPQNEFPVFYRHFRDRVTWFEADAVCQFHHAQLATVESNSQFEAIRSYLKELDVIENVWIGLKRNSEASEFTWTNYQPLARSGYFREEVPRSSDPVCVVTDPTANFKWHSLHCGGPEVASFVCELPVPYWASRSNGCMTSMMEGMTVTFLPERPAIQLTKECSPGVSKNITCMGNMKQSEIIEKLSCTNSNKPLKTFKPAKPDVDDIKLRTTTSSSESDLEDYAIEMATIAQYNDETFQSISKVMGHGSGGIVNLPQEMSIAQEPIKALGRGGFDTNGIDSAFLGAGQAETTSTTSTSTTSTGTASTGTVSTGTSSSGTTSASTGTTSTGSNASSTVTSTSTTSTTSTTPKAVPNTTFAADNASATTADRTTPTPMTTPTPTTGSDTLTTANVTRVATAKHHPATTAATPAARATTAAVRRVSAAAGPMTTVRGTLTGGSRPTETPTTTPTTATTATGTSHHHHHQRGHWTATTTADADVRHAKPDAARVYATTTVAATRRGRPAGSPMTTTEKIHTVAKMLAAESGADVRRPTTVDVRRPTTATLVAIATAMAKIPYTVASAATTGRPLNALRSYTNYDDEDLAAAAKDAPTTGPPIRVYKKIDFPQFPMDGGHDDYARKPAAVPFFGTSTTAEPEKGTGTDKNAATTQSSTPKPATTTTIPTSAAAAAIGIAAKHTDAPADTGTNVTTQTATANTESDTSSPLSPSLPPAKTAITAATTDTYTDNMAVTNAADAATVTAEIATTTGTTTVVSTTTVAASAATTNHRKITNYDAYTDHPNRSRHIVRPKQQHYHSYPYILYRLLG